MWNRNWKGALLLLGMLVISATVLSHDDLTRGPAGPTKAVLGLEIQTLLADERTVLAELQSRFERASDEAEVLAVQREIRDVKRTTELGILEAQLRFAEAWGDEFRSTEIARRIHQLEKPIVTPFHVRRDRPLPARAAN